MDYPKHTSQAPDEPIHVLHVDDDPEFADMAARFLEHEDDRFAIETATRVGDGLEQLERSAFDCVVSDYDMPDRDGLEFLEAVRENYPELPFILFTGKGSEEIASDAISAGVTDYLQKQSGTDQYTVLANRIGNAVAQTRARDALAASEKRLSLFIEQSPLGVIEWDEHFDIVQMNPAAEEILGYDEATLHGESWERIVPEDDRADVGDIVSALLDAEGGHHSVNHNVRGDGERIICEWHNRVVTDETGDTVAVFSQFQDITQRKEHETQLERTTARLTALYENSPNMINVHDIEGNIIDPNGRLCEATGYTAAELTDMTVWEVDQAIDPDEARRLWADMETGDTETREGLFRRRDGSTFPVEIHLRRLDLHGEDRFIVISSDISDRTERQRRLEAERDRFCTLFKHLSVPVVEVEYEHGDPVPLVTAVNPAFEETFGYTEAQLQGQSLDSYIVPDDSQEEALDINKRALGGESFGGIEVRRLTADGPRDFLLQNAVYPDEPGGFAIYTDITERRQREQALERERNRFETVFRTVPEPAVHVVFEEQAPIVQDVNDAFEDEFGYALSEARGTSLDSLIVPPDERERATDINRTVHADGLFQTEVVRETPTGERPFLFTARTMQVEDGDTTRVEGVATYVDLSEQKRREAELAAQNERLEQFAGVVSHDLRNPLNVAQGRLALAREECESDHLADVAAALERSQDLIDDLLTLARQGEPVQELEWVDLADTLDACWQHVATGDATMVSEIDRPTPIRADPDRLRQLLENLFRNAVEHGGDGVTITVGQSDSGFYVADDGHGIRPEDRSQVFDAGYSTQADGTGFGLQIVDEIVEAHGWQITTAESDAGGAGFDITGVQFEK